VIVITARNRLRQRTWQQSASFKAVLSRFVPPFIRNRAQRPLANLAFGLQLGRIWLRRPAKLLLVLALAGCSSTDWFHHNEPEKPTALPAQQASPQGTQAIPSQRNLSPAATAAAPPNANPGELMDCVTQSCKINCSPKVAQRFRPKWCANFKEPEPD